MDERNSLLQSQFSSPSVVGTSHLYFFHSLQNSKRLPAGGWPFGRHHGPFKKKNEMGRGCLRLAASDMCGNTPRPINGGRFTALSEQPQLCYSAPQNNGTKQTPQWWFACCALEQESWLGGRWRGGGAGGKTGRTKSEFHPAGSLNYHNWRPPLWGRIWQAVQNVILWTLSALNNRSHVWLCMTLLRVWRPSRDDESKIWHQFPFLCCQFSFLEKPKKGSHTHTPSYSLQSRTFSKSLTMKVLSLMWPRRFRRKRKEKKKVWWEISSSRLVSFFVTGQARKKKEKSALSNTVNLTLIKTR